MERLFETPEAKEIRRVGEIADAVQEMLMVRYGLDPRQFEYASKYIYGKKGVEIPDLEQKLSDNPGGFLYYDPPKYYSDDGTPLSPTFKDSHPAIYIDQQRRSVLANYTARQITDLLNSEQGIDALLTIVEEVGHFLDFQNDFILNRFVPDKNVRYVMTEGLALLHNKVILENLGTANISSDTLQNAFGLYRKKVERRRDGRLTSYRWGTKWIEGILRSDTPLPKNIAEFYQKNALEQLLFMKQVYEAYLADFHLHKRQVPERQEEYARFTEDLRVVETLIEQLTIH